MLHSLFSQVNLWVKFSREFLLTLSYASLVWRLTWVKSSHSLYSFSCSYFWICACLRTETIWLNLDISESNLVHTLLLNKCCCKKLTGIPPLPFCWHNFLYISVFSFVIHIHSCEFLYTQIYDILLKDKLNHIKYFEFIWTFIYLNGAALKSKMVQRVPSMGDKGKTPENSLAA